MKPAAKISILLEKYLTFKIPFPVHTATKSQALPKGNFGEARHVYSSLSSTEARPRHKYVHSGIRCPTSGGNARSADEQYLEVRATALLAPSSGQFFKTTRSKHRAFYRQLDSGQVASKHCLKVAEKRSNLHQPATFLERNKTQRPWHVGQQILHCSENAA